MTTFFWHLHLLSVSYEIDKNAYQNSIAAKTFEYTVKKYGHDAVVEAAPRFYQDFSGGK
jgi:hypothetical protein